MLLLFLLALQYVRACVLMICYVMLCYALLCVLHARVCLCLRALGALRKYYNIIYSCMLFARILFLSFPLFFLWLPISD